MPNVAGYKDLGGGLATLVFDDGQESQPVVLDDKLKAEVNMVASLVAPKRQALTDAGRELAQPAPASPPVPAVPSPQPTSFQPPPPVPRVPEVRAPEVPAPVLPPAGANLLPAQKTEANKYGADAPVVRDLLVDAAGLDAESAQAQVDARAATAEAKGRLIGERQAEMEIEGAAAKAEEDRLKQSITAARDLYAKETAEPLRPEAAFGDAPAWFKVLTLIGMAAGAASKGKNYTLESVNQTIEQSLEIQKQRKNAELTRLATVLGSDEAALNAQRARMGAAVERRLELGLLEADNEGEAAMFRAAKDSFAAKRKRDEAAAVTETATGSQITSLAPKPIAGGLAAVVNAETREEKNILAANDVDDKAFRKYTDERLKTGADAFLGSADAAEQVITKLTNGQDVPGSGPLDKLLQPVMREGDAAAVQQAAGMLTAQFGKMISGASMTDSERQMLNNLVAGRGTLEDWKRGIALLKNYAGTQLDTLNNGYPSESRAYDGIRGLRQGRKQLTEEQQRRKELQSKKPEPAMAPPAAPRENPMIDPKAPMQRLRDTVTAPPTDTAPAPNPNVRRPLL